MGQRGRGAQYPGQCALGRPDHERPMGQASRYHGAEHGFRGVREGSRQGHAARPHRHGRRVRQPRLLPCPPSKARYITGTAINVDGGRSPVV